jgi:hypothetical protein
VTLYEHIPHPHVEARKEAGPVKLADQHSDGSRIARFNARFAQVVTRAVGTMYCFYLFNLLASASAKSAFSSGSMTVIVNWVSSNWIQLILLPALMVGQNLQGRASDKRAEQTYNDAEAILHGLLEAQQHLGVQDGEITAIQAHLLTQDDRLDAIVDQVTAVVVRLTSTPPDAAPVRHGNT